MNKPSLTIDSLSRRVARHQKEYAEALRTHKLVTSEMWPEIKAWIEGYMDKIYVDARGESGPEDEADTNLRAMKMGEWATLRWLIAKGEEYKDISIHKQKLDAAMEDYNKKVAI